MCDLSELVTDSFALAPIRHVPTSWMISPPVEMASAGGFTWLRSVAAQPVDEFLHCVLEMLDLLHIRAPTISSWNFSMGMPNLSF